MPEYEYVCQDCQKAFAVRASIAEYSRGLEPQCLHCGSRKALRSFLPVSVHTGRPRSPAPGCCGPDAPPGCCRPS